MELSELQLKNKIIMVTGANQGIGKSASITYASLGAKVILLGRVSSHLRAFMMKSLDSITLNR